jgi:TrmH family RNA methyltransferase
MQIGPSHSAVKLTQSLLRGQQPPGAERLTVAEGFWAAEAVRQSGAAVRTLLWCPDALRGPEAVELIEALRSRAEESYEVSSKLLQRLAERDRPDGMTLVVELPDSRLDTLTPQARSLILVADGIEQPGNLGTLIRTLDACGADALVLTSTRTRRTNVRVFRASHGAVLWVPTIEADSIDGVRSWLADNDFAVYLADTAGAARYCNVRYAERTAIVMGNERFGIAPQWYGGDPARVFVPMLGRADSLNVSVSAAVLLYEARAVLADWRA